MPFTQVFVPNRLDLPYWPSLLNTLQQTDPSVRLSNIPVDVIILEKDTIWTAIQISQTQTSIDTTPTGTPNIDGQFQINTMAVLNKAILLTLLDQINIIRAALPIPLPAITPAQAIAAIRAKAGTL